MTIDLRKSKVIFHNCVHPQKFLFIQKFLNRKSSISKWEWFKWILYPGYGVCSDFLVNILLNFIKQISLFGIFFDKEIPLPAYYKLSHKFQIFCISKLPNGSPSHSRKSSIWTNLSHLKWKLSFRQAYSPSLKAVTAQKTLVLKYSWINWSMLSCSHPKKLWG